MFHPIIQKILICELLKVKNDIQQHVTFLGWENMEFIFNIFILKGYLRSLNYRMDHGILSFFHEYMYLDLILSVGVIQ